jgi:hypothetical protein
VAANETAIASLVMASSSVELRVKVPRDRGKDLVIEPVDGGASIGGRVRGIMQMGDEETCSFDYVQPGRYRVSLDRKHWTPITVDPSPAEQTIDLHDMR